MDMNTPFLILLVIAAAISGIYWLKSAIAAHATLTKNYQELTYKAVAIILAWFAWLVPLGLHRVMMRRRYAWLHPVAFLFATLASNKFFFYTPANSELGRIFAEQGSTPHFSDFSNVWLLSFTLAWFVLVVYDAVEVFSWSVNNPHFLVVDAQSSSSYIKPREQVADHDQAAQ